MSERRHPGLFSTELANGVTHGVGLLLSIAALVVLVVLAASRGGTRHVIACCIYGATLVILYLASTCYHAFPVGRAKEVFRVIDHIAIYLLIAGTYTPFALVTLRGGWGWSLFGVVWGLAVVGSGFKIFFTGRFEALSVAIYLAMGWMMVVATRPLLASLPTDGLLWIAFGGLAYTLGLIFYAWKSIRHHHAIWHVFVMVGSTSHFFAVMWYVLPSP